MESVRASYAQMAFRPDYPTGCPVGIGVQAQRTDATILDAAPPVGPEWTGPCSPPQAYQLPEITNRDHICGPAIGFPYAESPSADAARLRHISSRLFLDGPVINSSTIWL